MTLLFSCFVVLQDLCCSTIGLNSILENRFSFAYAYAYVYAYVERVTSEKLHKTNKWVRSSYVSAYAYVYVIMLMFMSRLLSLVLMLMLVLVLML